MSQLIHDPGAIATERWKILWHHYLIINGNRHFEHGWIAMKMASTPEELAAAPDKLFSGAFYDSGNDVAGGGSRSPVGGAPAIPLDCVLNPALNTCLFTEPGMYASIDALYMSLQCAHLSDSSQLIVLFKCASPCNTGSAASWSYLGTVLQPADAAALGFDTGFAAPGIFESAGRHYLVVTPAQTAGAPWASYYSGCRIFRFADIDSGLLEMTGSQPTLIGSVDGAAGRFNGACNYHPAANEIGMLYGELDLSAPDKFRIFKSHTNF